VHGVYPGLRRSSEALDAGSRSGIVASELWEVVDMTALFIILAIVAIVLILFGGFVQAVQWLIWVGIILLAIAIIAWLLRYISGRNSNV
jgi:hypothetical protein